MRGVVVLLGMWVGCGVPAPRVALGPSGSLSSLPLEMRLPEGWIGAAQADGSVIVAPTAKMRYASWIKVGPAEAATTEGAGWVEVLREQQVHPDPESEGEVTRLSGTFAAGHSRYPVVADIAYRNQISAVRASLATLAPAKVMP